MVRSADSHSRIVFWLKIILPMAALAVLSTLFLVSRNIGGDGVIPFSDVDLDAMAERQQLTAPEYSAMTQDGAAITVRSLSARPEAAGAAAAEVEASYVVMDGLSVTLTAGNARMDDAAGILAFGGGVRIETSTGYRMQAQDLVGQLDRTRLESPGAVTADAPFGRIEAGAMRLDRADVPDADSILVFNRGVRLIYRPKD